MRSPSRGHIKLKSKDPFEHPSILFNYMSTEQDWQEFRAAIRITREIMHQPALDPYRGEEISPGNQLSTDAQLDDFVRNHGETAYHPSCSCKMGEDEMAVVDHQGRVHGMQGLRVVDASIMPLIITGNLNATTIMMAEKLPIKSVVMPHSRVLLLRIIAHRNANFFKLFSNTMHFVSCSNIVIFDYLAYIFFF